MIGYLKGQVLEHSEGKMLLTIGLLGTGGSNETGSVGYQVTVPQSQAYLGFTPGKMAELFIYTHVREDILDLFGFSTRVEKELFLMLLNVNKIGPKVALSILSHVEPAQIIESILAGESSNFTKIPGVGKKTAERIALELSDSLKKKVDAGMFSEVRSPAALKKAAVFKEHPQLTAPLAVLRDAKEALVGLGYREQEVTGMLNRVIEEQGPPKRVEDLIRAALQQLN